MDARRANVRVVSSLIAVLSLLYKVFSVLYPVFGLLFLRMIMQSAIINKTFTVGFLYAILEFIIMQSAIKAAPRSEGVAVFASRLCITVPVLPRPSVDGDHQDFDRTDETKIQGMLDVKKLTYEGDINIILCNFFRERGKKDESEKSVAGVCVGDAGRSGSRVLELQSKRGYQRRSSGVHGADAHNFGASDAHGSDFLRACGLLRACALRGFRSRGFSRACVLRGFRSRGFSHV